MNFRRSVQVRSRGLQVLDMGSGDANVPLQVLRFRLSEAQRQSLWQSVLPQRSEWWSVLPARSSASQSSIFPGGLFKRLRIYFCL